jgi:NAD(P)-dependent dehydrogenase (short-subunit alcohol dehydrogenase family)
MAYVLITGANRGLGLEFARQYAADGWDVVCTCRDRNEAGELAAIGKLRIEVLDMTDLAAVAQFGAGLGDVRFDVLIANAGLMEPRGPVGHEYGEAWMRTLAVNAVAPALLAYGLKEKMARPAKAVSITSKMGSLADNQSGGYYAYRSSKAALNAGWRSLALDWRKDGIAAAMLHPGWVRTRMGGPKGLIDAPASVAGMRRVIDGLGLEQSGGFYNYDGTPIPW